MKRTLLVLSALSVAALFAQGNRAHRGNMGAMGTPPDPAKMVERRVSFLKNMLGLNDAQVTQATTIYTNAANSMTALHSSMAQARESLQAAVKTNDTAAIDQAANTIGSVTAQMTAGHSKADAAFYALLTADQKARFDAEGPGFGGFGPGRGMMGPPPGPPNQ